MRMRPIRKEGWLKYSDNLKSSTEMGGDFNDFDDKIWMMVLATRLQVDVAENKGYVYSLLEREFRRRLRRLRLSLPELDPRT